MSTLERAIALAATAHEGQLDKAGEPYILHPLRVMMRVKTLDEKMAAALHDVVEDTGVTLDDLREEGFSEEVVTAVEALTHGPDDDYEEAIRRAGRNPMARNIKMADLEDNLDMSRVTAPAECEERLKKYRNAVRILEQEFPVA